jgi:hypothetical protein
LTLTVGEAPQRVGEAVAADGIDHDVDLAACHDGVLEAVGEHELVGPRLQRDGTLLGRRRHRHDASRPERLRDLDRGGADATRGALHQHRLAGLQAAALDQGEVGGAVVEDDRRALLVADRVGQGEGLADRRDGELGEAAQKPEPSGAVTTSPAISAPGVNGRSGFIW